MRAPMGIQPPLSSASDASGSQGEFSLDPGAPRAGLQAVESHATTKTSRFGGGGGAAWRVRSQELDHPGDREPAARVVRAK